MRSFQFIAIGLLIVVLISGCVNTKLMHSKKDLPGWYLNPPEEEEYFYGTGEADGLDLGLTRASADAAARDDIARQVAIKVNNMLKSSKKQIGKDIDADMVNVQTNVSKQIASQVLEACKIIKRDVDTKKSGYTAYALAKMSLVVLKEKTKMKLKDQKIQRELKMSIQEQEELAKETEKINSKRQ